MLPQLSGRCHFRRRLCRVGGVAQFDIDSRPADWTDRKNNPSIDLVAGVSAWSLSGSMSAREQTVRGRSAAIWSRQS